jgi:hypothetical protein
MLRSYEYNGPFPGSVNYEATVQHKKMGVCERCRRTANGDDWRYIKERGGNVSGIQPFNCLLMGDNVTINAADYELL